jgi:hypothetical protein
MRERWKEAAGAGKGGAKRKEREKQGGYSIQVLLTVRP